MQPCSNPAPRRCRNFHFGLLVKVEAHPPLHYLYDIGAGAGVSGLVDLVERATLLEDNDDKLQNVQKKWLKRLTFLVDASEMLKQIKNHDPNSPQLHEINGLANVVFTNKEWNKDVNQDWYGARDRSALPKDVFGLLKLIRDTTGHLLELKKPDWDKKELLTHTTSQFPTLIMNVHQILKFHYRNYKIMKEYHNDTL
ncbi:hypothetical protein Tco_0695252 [Tanacetum coccineum]